MPQVEFQVCKMQGNGEHCPGTVVPCKAALLPALHLTGLK